MLLGTLLIAAIVRGGVGRWLPEASLLPAIGRSVLVGVAALATFLGLSRVVRLEAVGDLVDALVARLRRRRVDAPPPVR